MGSQRAGGRTARPPVLDVVRSRRVARAMVVDVALVLGFVAIGRRTHDEGTALAGVADTAAPFLFALFAGWLGVLFARLDPTSLRAGGVVVVSTVCLGMWWRDRLAEAPTPVVFVLVGAGFLTLFLLGWRVLGLLLRRAALRA